MFKIFSPILPGAKLGDRLLACCGAVIGISLTGLICALVCGRGMMLPFIVAPMGASAVLLFAVPASPLARPWSIVGGNTISALVGIAVGKMVHDPILATGLAVGLAIAAMSVTRCLHPPGGAAALTTIIGGPAVISAGFMFALVPVALNSALLVALGWLFHKMSRHSYPHIPAPIPANIHGTQDPPARLRVGFTAGDVDGAIDDLGETLDIDRDDLDRLLRRIEMRALEHEHRALLCADIMSRDIVSIGQDESPERAMALLRAHTLQTLPVLSGDGRFVGMVGWRELQQGRERVGAIAVHAQTAAPSQAAVSLLPVLTDEHAHAVAVIDDADHVVGIITPIDLLAGLMRTLEISAMGLPKA